MSSFVREATTSTSPPTQSTPFHTSRPQWTPHAYQIRAVTMMLKQACVGLFLDPGLGKTAVTLSAFRLLKHTGYVKRMLVIAPLRTCYAVWPEEMAKWTDFDGLTYRILHGPKRSKLVDDEADVFIMNVDNTRWFFEGDYHLRVKPDVLCVDESTKFKDSNSMRFKWLRKHLGGFKRRWILTGTPAPNGLIDLFAQMYLLDQGAALGSYVTHFRLRYFIQTNPFYPEWKPAPHAMEEITARIDPLVLRLKAEDYLKMPDLQFINIKVELPPDARNTYTQMERHFLTEVASGAVVAANAAVAGGKCRQIANGRVYDANRETHEIHDAKLDAFEDLIEELSGQPALVVYEFQHDVVAMRTRVQGPMLGGGTTPRAAAQAVEAFNAGQLPVLYGHPASMGHGLNLQGACNHVIFYGITWDLEHYDQVIRRVYRQGQRAGVVFVYHIVAAKTLDEVVLGVLRSKDRTQQGLLGALTNQSSSNPEATGGISTGVE